MCSERSHSRIFFFHQENNYRLSDSLWTDFWQLSVINQQGPNLRYIFLGPYKHKNVKISTWSFLLFAVSIYDKLYPKKYNIAKHNQILILYVHEKQIDKSKYLTLTLTTGITKKISNKHWYEHIFLFKSIKIMMYSWMMFYRFKQLK